MFEHYLHQHAPDPRRRLRFMIAGQLAAVGTASALGFAWLMGKMQIAQVTPPSANFVLVQMSLDTPPPPPPPPPAPAPTDTRDRPEPEEPDPLPPEDVTELLPPPKPRPGPIGNGAPDSKGISPIGVPGLGPGIPGINLPPGFTAPRIPTLQPPREESRPPVPFAVVRAQALYTPNPDEGRLAATRAGMFDKRPGENETGFCVGADGRTTEIRTVRRFPSDPGVDEVIRNTIKTWRFKPFLVQGKAVRTCTTQVFRISFK